MSSGWHSDSAISQNKHPFGSVKEAQQGEHSFFSNGNVRFTSGSRPALLFTRRYLLAKELLHFRCLLTQICWQREYLGSPATGLKDSPEMFAVVLKESLRAHG